MTEQQLAPMRFIVALTFHIAPGHEAEAAALIPQERAHIDALHEQGIVESRYVSADQARVWLVMRGASQADVAQMLTGFPLYLYLRPVFTELLPE